MYKKLIMEATNCNESIAAIIEDIMRHDIFRSTLDWQTAAQLKQAAKVAAGMLVARS